MFKCGLKYNFPVMITPLKKNKIRCEQTMNVEDDDDNDDDKYCY